MRTRLLLVCVFAILVFTSCTRKPPATEADQSASQQANTAPGTSPAATPTPAAPAPEPVKAPEPAPKPPKPVVIPAGTVITVRIAQALGSKTSTTGDSFSATVVDPIEVDGKVVIPEGSSATGTVVEAKAKGKIKGEARLQLALTNITIKGKTYPIETSMSDTTSKGKGKRTAVATGGGAAGGALIGGIAGGGKGAAIGAGVGAAAGFLGGAFTGNKQIELPAESALSFELKSPISLK